MNARQEMELARKIFKALEGGLQGENWQCEHTDGYQYGEPTEIKYRVYHSDGYCVDVEAEQWCEPEEAKDSMEVVLEDGWAYQVTSPPFDGFKDATIQDVERWIESEGVKIEQ